ncbi:hypothetical protein T492DRAFT_931249, partial [Pavlovales sp. CCMP2436]
AQRSPLDRHTSRICAVPPRSSVLADSLSLDGFMAPTQQEQADDHLPVGRGSFVLSSARPSSTKPLGKDLTGAARDGGTGRPRAVGAAQHCYRLGGHAPGHLLVGARTLSV